MLGGGIMVNFVSYEALKPNVDIDKYPELKTMDEMQYPFMRSSIVESKEIEKKEQPKTEVKPTQKQKKLSTVMYKGIARDLTNAIKIINESEPTNIKHMCTRAVSNALEGIQDVHRASGVENPKAMYNLLKKDGWTDVLDENYTPKAGDVWTYYANNNKMHTSMFDGEKWMSYDVEGQQPWYYGYRNDGKGHIQRYIPKAQLGIKFVSYEHQKIKPEPEEDSIDLSETMPFKHYVIPFKSVENDIAVGVAPVIEPQNYQLSTPVGNIITPTKQYMYNLYSKILQEQGIDTSYAKWLVAHDVLESGHNYEKPSGKFNYGGIKGNGTKVSTHEVINGKRVKVNAGFKDYNSPEEYARDKVRLMKDKYHAFEGDYSTHLKGYATDPNYIKLLRAVHKSLKV